MGASPLDEVPVVAEQEDVLNGIGSTTADKLAEADIYTIDQLADADPTDVAQRTTLSTSRVETLTIKAANQEHKSITSVRGIGPECVDQLDAVGIETVGDLAAVNPEELATDADLSAATLRKLVAEAAFRQGKYKVVTRLVPNTDESPDILRGIGPGYASLLAKVGIDTVGDLAIANPKSLAAQ